jgi:hypothetical protein
MVRLCWLCLTPSFLVDKTPYCVRLIARCGILHEFQTHKQTYFTSSFTKLLRITLSWSYLRPFLSSEVQTSYKIIHQYRFMMECDGYSVYQDVPEIQCVVKFQSTKSSHSHTAPSQNPHIHLLPLHKILTFTYCPFTKSPHSHTAPSQNPHIHLLTLHKIPAFTYCLFSKSPHSRTTCPQNPHIHILPHHKIPTFTYGPVTKTQHSHTSPAPNPNLHLLPPHKITPFN